MATTKATTLAHTLGGISSDISTAEINRLDGVTGDIQTQITALDTAKAPKASPTFTGTITAPNDSISGDAVSGGTIGAGTLGANVVATDLVVNLPTYASIPFATSTITQHASTYVKVGLLNQTDRAFMPKKTGFSVNDTTDEIIVADAGTYIMSSHSFTVGAASSRENQMKWIVKNDATPSAHNDGTLIQWWYYVNAGTNNSGTTEYITSGITSIVELAANDHLMLWALAIYGTQTVSSTTDYGRSHVSFIKIK